jgi:hypothetical protein
LESVSAPESILKITAFETESGTNTLNSITVYVEEDMICNPTCTESPFTITDLGTLSATSDSGLSLWLDDGDGTFNANLDTLVSSTTATRPSDWAVQTVTDDWGGTFNVWQTSFSNLNIDIPSAYGSLTLFVAARAGG